MRSVGEEDPDLASVAYDTELVPWLFEQWAGQMVDLMAPASSSRVVDLACGSGLIVRHLLARLGSSGRVHGVDLDSAMLAYAATTVDDSRVSWHESDAAHLPFESDSMDRVCCHQGLQFFPDRLAALADVRRVLEPGGRLAVATWGQLEDNPWPAALSAAVGWLLGDDAGAGMAVVCELGDSRKLNDLLGEAGFQEIEVDTHERSVTHPDVRTAVAGQLSALPSGSLINRLSSRQRAELSERMCELLADHVDPSGRLELTSTCNLARGIKPRSRSANPGELGT